MIIGTAGHIDHGKTALIRALTGVPGDRLKEEQARGITIDLGFAYLSVGDELVLGFVDVPGHERFVHTMVAGAAGIDFALLVVAADDGVMPQTREHLAILDLLHVRRGLIALTKSDLATHERFTEVADQIRETLLGTTFANAEIIPVSTRTSEGISALRQRLIDEARGWNQRAADGRFRLAVDRAFTLTGIGLVVTGTVLSGRVRRDDVLIVSPKGIQVRVRSVHAQNRPVDLARAGDRCALNLAGPDARREAIQRGDVLLDPSLHAPTDRVDANLLVLANARNPIEAWLSARLHVGSAEVGVRVVPLDTTRIAPGEQANVQLVLERPIAAAALDRFVLRDASAQHTIGGGMLIDLRAPARRRRTSERRAQRVALAIEDDQTAFATLLNTPPFAWDAAAFARDRALSVTALDVLFQQPGIVTVSGEADQIIALDGTHWKEFVAHVVAVLDAFHADTPDVQGMSRERLRSAVKPNLPATAFAGALHHPDFANLVMIDGAFVRRTTHAVQLRAEHTSLWPEVGSLLSGDARFRPPRVRDVAAALARSEEDIRQLMKSAARAGLVDEIAPDHFFLRATTEEMMRLTAELSTQQSNGRFTAAQFRDRLNNGRKVAIQILEFFDRQRLTRKQGTERRIGPGAVAASQASRGQSADPGRESFPVGRPDFKSG